jgi:hypothetical protein
MKNIRNLLVVRKNQLIGEKANEIQDSKKIAELENEISELEGKSTPRKKNHSHFGEKYDYMHILQDGEYEFTVKGYGTYERSSVLAGQVKICFVDSFDTLEEAQAEYPEADLSSGMMEPQNTFDHLPDGPDDGYFGYGWED